MFRILCLDGGGIKGAFTASVLSTIENEIGGPIGEYFDLVAGTSTGGILAIGLGLRMPAKSICQFYRERGPEIFPAAGPLGINGFFRQMFMPRYSHATLRAALEGVLQQRKFGESKNRLIIPTYDANRGTIFILKTAHHERFKYDYMANAVDVALATSAAPTYFAASPFPPHQGSSYVDGGVWANCPVLAAITEAVCFLNVPLDDIRVLSIGTTSAPFNIAENKNAGALQWNVGMINLMFEGQAESARAQARLLLKKRLYRLDVTTRPGEFSLGDASPEKIDRLIDLGSKEAKMRENLDMLQTNFFSPAKADPFVPCYNI